MRRSEMDKSSFFWVKNCGVCHPGGGPSEYDRKGNRYDEFAKDYENYIQPGGDNFLDGDYYQSDWAKSGVSEADCFVCHLEGYDWKARALTLGGGYFSWAPTAGAGWYRDLKESKPPLPGMPVEAVSLQIDYSRREIADPENLAQRITREVPDRNCWNCHAAPDLKKRGRVWSADSDIHKAKGLTCVYCHPAGEDHEIAKGDAAVGSVRDELDGTMKSCSGCHLEAKDKRAPQVKHSFPDVHLKKITCEACHIPYKDKPALAVIDNATSGKTIGYQTHEMVSNDHLNPDLKLSHVPATRWYPAFVRYKGKIKPVDPMQSVWWGDWDRESHRVIPIFLWRIRDFTGAGPGNRFSVNNAVLKRVLNGSKEVNTLEEIETYLTSISKAVDRYGCPLVCHTAVLVKGSIIYYMEHGELRKEPMPKHEGEFICCEPFDLSHNIVGGNMALGANGCQDCHTTPSPFFHRKILKDPFNEDGKRVYTEAWELLGYSREEMLRLTK